MKRLYYESSYIKEFQGTVTGCQEGKNGRVSHEDLRPKALKHPELLLSLIFQDKVSD